MYDYRNKTDEELREIEFWAIANGNHNAAQEVRDFREFYGKIVEVFKGSKVPVGTRGKVFFVKRKNFGKYADPWGIYSTTIVGIIDDAGNKFYTNCQNCRIID